MNKKTITYKEANTDKFILCDFTQTSIFSVKVASGSATINIASVYDYQFSNFPINIDYIKFEKVENNSYEIKKTNPEKIYLILLINLNQSLTTLEIIFDKNEYKNPFIWVIILISVSGVVWLAIIIIVIIIVIKKIKRKNPEIEVQSFKN